MTFYILCPYILIVFLYIYASTLFQMYNTPILENYWLPSSFWTSNFKYLSYQLGNTNAFFPYLWNVLFTSPQSLI